MAEVRAFPFPDLGEGLTEGEIVEWLVAVGDTVRVDQPVVEVTTEKASVQVPTPFAGTVVQLHGEPGETIKVGSPLISIDVAVAAPAAQPAAAEPAVDEPAAAAPKGSGNLLVGYGTAEEAAKRRPRVCWGSAPAGPTPQTAVRTPSSPLVRRHAAEAGVDLSTVTATGPQGSVSQRDLEQHLAAQHTNGKPAEPRERIPLTGPRRITAERLSRSHAEVPAAATWVTADATALMALREQMNARQNEVHVTPLAVLLRLVVAALRRYPVLNAHFDSDAGETLVSAAVHLGVAVQTERGLLVPVIRNAQKLSGIALAAELQRLSTAANDGSIAATELSGSTFTLSNFGSFGVDGGTPIINPPEAAILGVGRIAERPWVYEGAVVPRKVVELSLVFDHRVCDGGVAGGFTRYLGDLVEQPALALADG